MTRRFVVHFFVYSTTTRRRKGSSLLCNSWPSLSFILHGRRKIFFWEMWYAMLWCCEALSAYRPGSSKECRSGTRLRTVRLPKCRSGTRLRTVRVPTQLGRGLLQFPSTMCPLLALGSLHAGVSIDVYILEFPTMSISHRVLQECIHTVVPLFTFHFFQYFIRYCRYSVNCSTKIPLWW